MTAVRANGGSNYNHFNISILVKITSPPQDFTAQRTGNGTVHMTWDYHRYHLLLNLYHGSKITVLLMYRPFMQSDEYLKRPLGSVSDLSDSDPQIILNDLPNSQVLEMCLRLKKSDSKVDSWSPCSNKVILRPMNLPTSQTPKPINVICEFLWCNNTGRVNKPPVQNKLKSKVTITTTAVVLFATIFIFTCVIKRNWRRIK